MEPMQKQHTAASICLKVQKALKLPVEIYRFKIPATMQAKSILAPGLTGNV